MLLVSLSCLLAVSYTGAIEFCYVEASYKKYKKYCDKIGHHPMNWNPKPPSPTDGDKKKEKAAEAKAAKDAARRYLQSQKKKIYSVALRNALIELGAPKTARAVDVNAWYGKETKITIQLHQLAVQLNLTEQIKATTFDHHLIPYGVVIKPLSPKPSSQAQSQQGHSSSKSQPGAAQVATGKSPQSHSSSKKSQPGVPQAAAGNGGVVFSSINPSVNSRESFPLYMNPYYDGEEEALNDYPNGFHENALDDWDDADLWDTSDLDTTDPDPIRGIPYRERAANFKSKESVREHAFRKDNPDSDSDSSDPAEQASNPGTDGNSDAAGPENEPDPGELPGNNPSGNSDATDPVGDGPENEPDPGELPGNNPSGNSDATDPVGDGPENEPDPGELPGNNPSGNSDATDPVGDGPENEPDPGELPGNNPSGNSDATDPVGDGPENEPDPGELPGNGPESEPDPGYGGDVSPSLEQYENEEESELSDFNPISRQQATEEAEEEDGVKADEEQVKEDEAEDAAEAGEDAAEDAAEDTADIGEAGEIAEEIGILAGL